jgi:hypothetical protein
LRTHTMPGKVLPPPVPPVLARDLDHDRDDGEAD